MTPAQELLELAKKLKELRDLSLSDAVSNPLSELAKAASEVGKSFSGSWQGYHSKVYYANFEPPPPGAHFSQEWGLKQGYSGPHSPGDWQEYDPEEVKNAVYRRCETSDLTAALEADDKAAEGFSSMQSDVISILQNEIETSKDSFLENLLEEIKELKIVTPFEIAQYRSPKGQIMTRDTIVLGQGAQIPPHLSISSQVDSIRNTFGVCDAASLIATKAASHLERKYRRSRADERIGTNVFIGHGQSSLWKDLKDFVQDRLKLPWDEFNRVPVAGITNIARLSEMLDAAAIAFLVMTAEDEMADGETQARMNVVHEAGLFQGRIGFTRAIVLLEEGCKSFSNIDGLGQIRFPKGDISAKFEEIRRVLEREGLIEE